MNETVLIIGDDPTCHTGFAKVVDNIVDAVFLAGLTPYVVGKKHSLTNQYKCSLVNSINQFNDPTGKKAVEQVLKDQKPAIVITVGDPWDIDYIPELKATHCFAWIYYMPVETSQTARFFMVGGNHGRPVYLDVANLISRADKIIAYSQMGSNAIKNMLTVDYVNTTNKSYVVPEIPWIYHGVDTKIYQPATEPEKIAAKKMLFPTLDAHNLLLYTCIKTNSFRVGFDTLLNAWARFVSKYRNTVPNPRNIKLYLHTNMNGNGYQLPSIINRLGIADSVILDKNIQLGAGASETKMKLIYNATDVSINAVRGEGFGLPQLEAMACGIPGIYPNCGTPPEFLHDGAILIPIAATYQPDFAPINFSIADEEQMAEAMMDMTASHVRRWHGEKGINIAASLTWDVFHKNFADQILDTLKNKPTDSQHFIGWEIV